MSVALGKKILGILLAIAGVNVVFQGHALSEPGGVADLVTGAIMFAIEHRNISMGISSLGHGVGAEGLRNPMTRRGYAPSPNATALGDRQLSTRRGASRPTWPSCRSWCAKLTDAASAFSAMRKFIAEWSSPVRSRLTSTATWADPSATA